MARGCRLLDAEGQESNFLFAAISRALAKTLGTNSSERFHTSDTMAGAAGLEPATSLRNRQAF